MYFSLSRNEVTVDRLHQQLSGYGVVTGQASADVAALGLGDVVEQLRASERLNRRREVANLPPDIVAVARRTDEDGRRLGRPVAHVALDGEIQASKL